MTRLGLDAWSTLNGWGKSLLEIKPGGARCPSSGYKVTDLIVNGISMASAQHSDLVSVIQRNNGQVPALLVALREKNASNGILR